MRARWQSWAAWWSGDLDRLKSDTPCTAPGGYWARRNKPGATQIHLPLAGDLARTASELMYGDTPVLEFEGDAATQKVWDQLSQTIGWANTLLESGEVGGALGGSYLKPGWDTTVADHPLPMVVRADMALPEFRFNTLRSVTFVTELAAPADWTARNRAEVWRWLEHHEPGQIRQELWLGSVGNIGNPLPLTEHPHTEHLEAVIDTRPIRDGILVEYIPNDLPQPLDTLPLGRSVLQGVETLLDQLDETFDSWMRDIRLGKGRILLSREMLDPVGPQRRSGIAGVFGRRNTTAAGAFDVDAEAFVGLEMTPEGKDGGPAPITHVQFAIRVQEHLDTCMTLIEQITARAGFSPQTMGMNVDGQLSGTAMRRREQRTYRTRDRMRRYARPALERFAETLMAINAWAFNGPRPQARPTLAWRETDQADPKENAEVIDVLRRAMVLSVETAVQMAHPEWDDKQVGEEVDRLMKEQAALTAPALDGMEPLDPEVPDGGVTKEQVDMFRALWLSGVDPAEAARKVGGRVRGDGRQPEAGHGRPGHGRRLRRPDPGARPACGRAGEARAVPAG
jgi:A118 family predicted phage portal protein